MTTLLARVPSRSARTRCDSRPVIDGCAPDCVYEYLCDSNHQYFRRLCCYRTDCTWYCEEWVRVAGSC